MRMRVSTTGSRPKPQARPGVVLRRRTARASR
jgi:hypothetical protein